MTISASVLAPPAVPTGAPARDGGAAAPTAPACAALTVVLFGVTGDLARRKLLPALTRLADGYAPVTPVRLLGVGRSEIPVDAFRAAAGLDGTGALEVDYVGGGYGDAATYERIRRRLVAARPGGGEVVVFYVATPPEAFEAIVENLGRLCDHVRGAGRQCRVLIEKPFGEDLTSARELLAHVTRSIRSDELLLVDHYLAKPEVRQLERLRIVSDRLAGRLDRSSVAHVQITIAETLGVDGRGGFYDRVGALRDVIQNHGLQLCAAVLSARRDVSGRATSWPDRRLRALEQLSVDTRPDGTHAAVRGQYGPVPGSFVRAYADESGVADGTRTETFAALRLRSSDPRWAGVPVYLRTGKRLAQAVCDIRIQLRGAADGATRPGRAEGDVIHVSIKGDPFVRMVTGGRTLDLASADPALAQDYVHIFHSATVGERGTFPDHGEMLRSWEIVEPVIREWEGGGPVAVYPAGSWGPEEAGLVMAGSHVWSRPRA
ncbi:glucose-6-phosphate dehydrogenase (NADP(+)) [Georgenia subflava]|uniref:Glucose-6-phosphate dehydrogenase n=1 Tax=Georgenia subflava TaxID=1622177 RepID=A0A6N7EQ20_9MICO|nr:hypothetical protein [Georgenia subflava]MPV38605.1 hypothetical protein [Georgenia subflava]